MNYKNYIPKGIKLTDADHKFIEKHIASHMPASNVVITNPFSGESMVVNPLLGTVLHMVQALSGSGFSGRQIAIWNLTEGNAVQKFDRARMIILKLDHDAYSNFVD